MRSLARPQDCDLELQIPPYWKYFKDDSDQLNIGDYVSGHSGPGPDPPKGPEAAPATILVAPSAVDMAGLKQQQVEFEQSIQTHLDTKLATMMDLLLKKVDAQATSAEQKLTTQITAVATEIQAQVQQSSEQQAQTLQIHVEQQEKREQALLTAVQT